MPQLDIDYRTQPTEARKDSYWKYVLHFGIYTTVYTITALGIALFVMPRFIQLFRQSKSALPAITETTLRFTRTLQNFWIGMLVLVLMLVTSFILAAITTSMRNPDSRRRFYRAIVRSISWLAFLAALWLCISILVPLFRLVI